MPITGALESMSTPFTQHLVEAAATSDVPIVVVWGSPTESKPFTEILAGSSRLATVRTFHNAVRVATAYFDHHEFRARYRSAFAHPPTRRSAAAAEVEHLLTPGRTLSEHESKQVLAAYGVRVTRDILATSRDEAHAAAKKIKHKVVMKIASPDIAHKSDLGPGEGRHLQRRRRRRPTASSSGGPRPRCPTRTSTACWCARPPRPASRRWSACRVTRCSGPTVAFGLGGVFVEVFDDLATACRPSIAPRPGG